MHNYVTIISVKGFSAACYQNSDMEPLNQNYSGQQMTQKLKNAFTNYHTTNKCTNCMSFIFKSLF